MKQMKHDVSQNSQNEKMKKWTCKICDYNTSKKSDLVKHTATRKHIKRQNETENLSKVAKPFFICELCDKSFKSRTSVWRHNKKCQKKGKNGISNVRKSGQINCQNGKKTTGLGEKKKNLDFSKWEDYMDF